jgi:hypothetical protein
LIARDAPIPNKLAFVNAKAVAHVPFGPTGT